MAVRTDTNGGKCIDLCCHVQWNTRCHWC